MWIWPRLLHAASTFFSHKRTKTEDESITGISIPCNPGDAYEPREKEAAGNDEIFSWATCCSTVPPITIHPLQAELPQWGWCSRSTLHPSQSHPESRFLGGAATNRNFAWFTTDTTNMAHHSHLCMQNCMPAVQCLRPNQ